MEKITSLIKEMRNKKIKVNVETFINDPYMFVLRARERAANINVEDNELIVTRNDSHNTRVTAIPLKDITSFDFMKTDNTYDIWLNVRELGYNIYIEAE